MMAKDPKQSSAENRGYQPTGREIKPGTTSGYQPPKKEGPEGGNPPKKEDTIEGK